tara:strand:+ start:94 stop:225 length:132 start_codon:yes stop_codon:yes gene_type:complete
VAADDAHLGDEDLAAVDVGGLDACLRVRVPHEGGEWWLAEPGG